MTRVPALISAIVVLAAAVAGCGSGSSSSSSTTTAQSSSAPSGGASPTSTPSSGGASPSGAAGSVHVSMKNVAFSPTTVHAKIGETILWTNDDSPAHNVTWVSGPKFTSSGTIDPGGKFQIKLTQAGTIAYYCTIHPFMKATIVVTK